MYKRRAIPILEKGIGRKIIGTRIGNNYGIGTALIKINLIHWKCIKKIIILILIPNSETNNFNTLLKSRYINTFKFSTIAT